MDDIDIGVPYLSDVQVSSTVLRRLQLIAPRTREWDNNPAAMSKEERELSLSKGGLRGMSNEVLTSSEKLGKRTPIIVTDVPEDFDPNKELTD